MPIQIACPTCQRQLRVPDNLIGQLVKCPSCQNTFTATAEESTPRRDENVREEPPAREDRHSTLEERYQEDEPRRRRRRDNDDEFNDRPRRRREGMEPHRGTIILVLGILGLVGIGTPITGIIAWVMGNSDMAKIRAGTMDPEGESNTNIGRILGMVSTILFLLTVVPFFFCCCLGGMGGAFKH
jgi:predicted Zn finger-like uncharacterized protein